MNFNTLGINNNLCNILKKQGITNPTPIQEAIISQILSGQNCIAEAPTGTGKTLAFLLPIIQKINTNSPTIQALILSPTRELALQITTELEKLTHNTNIGSLSIYGGRDTATQIKKLKKDIHIVVATTGRLKDHLDQNTISLKNINTLVIDEADQMLVMGFRPDIEYIIKFFPKKYQTLCFSATMSASTKKLVYKITKDPLIISVNPKNVTHNAITQEVVETTDRQKQEALLYVLQEDNPYMAIIFCRTKRRVDNLYEAMKKQGYNCIKLHSDILQSKRERLMKSFKQGDVQYLISTDVASRGIDISGVDYIYNYDIPENTDIYIHRIGRTARAGETGYTCMFVDPKNSMELKEIENTIGKSIKRRNV